MKAFNHHVPWEERYGFSQALQVDETIYISGQFAHDADGSGVSSGGGDG
jgi:enamine deaminase RidA (YjgF/YER057c/UK114 family)